MKARQLAATLTNSLIYKEPGGAERNRTADLLMVDTPQGQRPAVEVLTGGTYHREFIDDPERIEYFVPINWLHTVPLDQAVDEIGLFGNQNTVCKPTTPKWRSTVDRLKERWPEVV
jgi:hypothetical protein